MIDYSRIKDPEYFKNTLEDINHITDPNMLANLLKILSIKISNKEVDPIDANMLLSTIKNRNHVLTEARKNRGTARGNTNSPSDLNYYQENDNSGGRQMALSPTSVSNRNGAASIILIIAGVAVTTVMYTLLWIANFIK